MAANLQTNTRKGRVFRKAWAGSLYPEAARAHWEAIDRELDALFEITRKVVAKAAWMGPFPSELTDAITALKEERARCRKVETRYHAAVSDYLHQRVKVDQSVTRLLCFLATLPERPFEQEGQTLESLAALTPAQLIRQVPIILEATPRSGAGQTRAAVEREVGLLARAQDVLLQLAGPYERAIKERKDAMQDLDVAFGTVARKASPDYKRLLIDKGVVLSLKDVKRSVLSLFFYFFFATRRIFSAADRAAERHVVRHLVVRRALLAVASAAVIGGAAHHALTRSHTQQPARGAGIQRN